MSRALSSAEHQARIVYFKTVKQFILKVLEFDRCANDFHYQSSQQHKLLQVDVWVGHKGEKYSIIV
jgi:hypothetical protein